MAFINNWLNAVLNVPRSISQSMWSAQSALRNNPLTWARRDLQGLAGQARTMRDMPRVIGNQLLPPQLRPSGGKQRSATGKPVALPEVDARLERRGKRRGHRVRTPASRAELSQIHLTYTATGERHVLHVGRSTGQGSVQLRVDTGAAQPVLLEFAQENQTRGTTAMLTYLAGASNVMVDAVPVDRRAVVKDGSIITVGSAEYTVELFSFRNLPLMTRVDAAWATNVGPIRDVNQDAIGIYQHRRAYLFAIADGVGGGYAGDEVSAFAVQYLLMVFKKNIPYELAWHDIFTKAYEHINAEVRTFALAAPSPAGCTLTAVVIKEWTAYVAHVGDSRLYLLRGARFARLTTDHNRNVPVESSEPGNAPVRTRSVLERAIGKTDTIEPELQSIPIQPGDKLLLVTDGVNNQLADHEIEEIVATRRLDEIPDLLVEKANQRGNFDNASAIVIQVLDSVYARDDWKALPDERVFVGGANYPLNLERPREMITQHPSVIGMGCVAVVGVLLLLGLCWGSLQLWQGAQQWLASADAAASTEQPTAVVIPSLTPLSAAQPINTTPSTSLIPTLTLPPSITPLAPTSTLRADADLASTP